MGKQKESKQCPGMLNRKDRSLFCFGVGRDLHFSTYTPNIVGCTQMNLGITPYREVYRYGKWLNLRGDFMFDLPLMKKLVNQAKADYFGCPFLNEIWAFRFIAFWPKIVNPNEDTRLTIWPPVIGNFEQELLDLGLSMQGPPPTPYGEEFPVFTDPSFFLELINDIYGDNIEDETKAGLLASYSIISEQILHYMD